LQIYATAACDQMLIEVDSRSLEADKNNVDVDLWQRHRIQVHFNLPQ